MKETRYRKAELFWEWAAKRLDIAKKKAERQGLGENANVKIANAVPGTRERFRPSPQDPFPVPWIAYLDSDLKQIGERENSKGTEVNTFNLIILPPVTRDFSEVCGIDIYDAPENGQLLAGWRFHEPETFLEGARAILCPPIS